MNILFTCFFLYVFFRSQLTAIQREFPRLPQKFPGLFRKFPDFPGGQRLSLGSLTRPAGQHVSRLGGWQWQDTPDLCNLASHVRARGLLPWHPKKSAKGCTVESEIITQLCAKTRGSAWQPAVYGNYCVAFRENFPLTQNYYLRKIVLK